MNAFLSLEQTKSILHIISQKKFLDICSFYNEIKNINLIKRIIY